MEEIKVFSPATVANVACGFDVLGFCLDGIGDEMIIRKSKDKGVRITVSDGYDLPLDIDKNIAGVSAKALYEKANPDFGFELEIYKRIKPGSGIGSSAASAVGSVFGMNQLLGKPFNQNELIEFAMKGEALASAAEHADNIAPALLGGFTLVKNLNPLRILQIPSPEDLYAVIVHQQIEIKTSEARSVLPAQIKLKDATTQWANLGSLIHALHTNDYALIGECLEDVVAEPYRSKVIPAYEILKKAAKTAGALGTSISGSGPSIFSLCQGIDIAKEISSTQKKVLNSMDVSFEVYISKINTKGVSIL
ncbi:homoserine kinase [Formosa sp. Hel3_A1_48]|uniref:homoserine kinase n=1 Tax=Formosa sp. Hel3_A1_48 TaxID=1336795 RepID=UPI0008658266|nr:homoserine kinase [Formosa sp. Hel3_A1_48]AOR27013.1 homoserine kinase [Formosa sp. Hel3_A1_48]MDC0949833.1 homoserine kinase [Flavobacteriaceae bacterium]